MASPALRVPTAAWAARVSPASRRPFHSSPRRFNANGSGGKPADEPLIEQNDDIDTQTGTETAGGRSRSTQTGSQRTRRVRRKPTSELPPVKLPSLFVDKNVSVHRDDSQPILPKTLAEDAKYPKRSMLFAAQGPATHQTNQTLENYFETVVDHLLETDQKLAEEFERAQLDVDDKTWNSPEKIARVARLWDVIVDSAWHLTDSVYPARQATYTYKKRPFWWWHLYKDLDPKTHKLRDLCCRLELALENHLQYAELLDTSLAHAISDLPVDTFTALKAAIGQELHSKPSGAFDSKTNKRPINILSMSGYAGTSIAESTANHIAWLENADIIHLDAQDLSLLVGDYLGQNWAYSRGALSMLGFRAAELNGKLVRDRDRAVRAAEDEDPETEATTGINVRSGNLWEDLQELKADSLDSFNRWESLKIDKVLDNIIRASETGSEADTSRPLVIHIHDVVELSMTMEGSFLLNRLRALVDAAWQEGRSIAIFGTSSSEHPSDSYQNAISELAQSDFVVTRHLQAGSIDADSKDTMAIPRRFNLQKTDMFFENVRNIDRMLHALDPDTKLSVDDWVDDYLYKSSQRFDFMRDSILPIPEIYHLATSIKSSANQEGGSAPAGVLQRVIMGKLRQQPGQKFLDEEDADSKTPTGSASATEETKTEPTRAPMKLNEYEKRISSGQINKENLRITFADVHVPKDTISALKLLTSLALVRPDAFAYGVLASDKIPGCLLYGPPGTGKTMLAKAVAKESGANMLEVSGATINDKWVGESEKLIRAVFTLAKKLSPCVVFIDEADSLLANRSMFRRASHREHINQFLKEWDGMEETNAFIMVATNRPFDLDDAVLRRLPRKLLVDLPLKDDREAILGLLLKDEKLDSSVSLKDYAERTAYYSGSDLKNVCVAAAMAAVEEENQAAANHTGPEPFTYPERRVLRADHFENAMKQIPASISEDMVSLKQIRKFDEEYGNRKRSGKKSSMGFGVLPDLKTDSNEARIRPGASP